MYIEPNTNIKILKNCPLDNTYNHTIYFSSASNQLDYFSSLAKYTLGNYSYQRVQRGVMRVQIKAENLYDCNYLMFQNESFGSKWFYGFITGVEYVNNITSEITFEIDVMQTWFFDYKLKESFVVREHSATDSVGSNLLPEDVELGEYVSSSFDAIGEIAPLSIVVASTFDSNYKDVGGGYWSGMFSGLYFNIFPNTIDGASKCEEFILGAEAKSDGIVAVFLIPTVFASGVKGKPPKVFEKTFTKKQTSIGGYTPRNKKLLTYPYNFLYITNLQGNSGVYPYEYFDGSVKFSVAGDLSPNPSVIISPLNYKGVTNNFDEKMVLSGYPQLSYTTDTFKAWLAQNASSLAVNALSTGMNYSLANKFANPETADKTKITSGSGLALGIASSVSQIHQASLMPNQAHGGGGSQTLASMALINFAVMNKHIQPQFAKIIDDYFDMFGYSTNKVKVPNRTVRPHWCFTQTLGCVATGSVPADDMNKICSIYDNGITFWKSGAEVGNYTLNNQV